MLLDMGFTENNIIVNELLPERIAALKTNYRNIKLIEGDALKINVNQTFDIVFQSTVFTSILSNEDRINLATKMWEMLKPGGIILWYDFI
jgi:phospholipid N-methyltransferase